MEDSPILATYLEDGYTEPTGVYWAAGQLLAADEHGDFIVEFDLIPPCPASEAAATIKRHLGDEPGFTWIETPEVDAWADPRPSEPRR